uniref:ribose-5-phosphate isomerase n=1 Tax=Lankesteria abbotti TaxID=340204 RepID=A0A7S2QR59_9APIC|mmetsp:Transcript_2979/g.3333  ORF Transcript_2979/g.3333 Transcript_2979/m.3333 type:complete len:202 (+) Transcript_2979:350-955(+)
MKSRELENVLCIPTSEATKELAQNWSIPLTCLDDNSVIDVAIDGADEVDQPHLNLVKGRGGALLREKLVAEASKVFVVVTDISKMQSVGLGTSGAFPVEIIQFCHKHIIRNILSLPSLPASKKGVLRMKDKSGDNIPYVTDNGNFIVDLFFDQALEDAPQVAAELTNVVGVVEHGLFLDMTTAVVVATNEDVNCIWKTNAP